MEFNAISKSNKKEGKLSVWVVSLSCICSLVQLYALAHDSNALISYSVRALQLIWLLAGGIVLFNKCRTLFPQKMLGIMYTLLLSVISLGLAAVVDTSKFANNGIHLLGFLTLPLMLFYSAYRNTEKAKKTVILFHVCASFIYLSLYHSPMRHVFTSEYGEINMDAATLGYNNPNLTAMFLLVCVIGLVTGVFYFKTPIAKVLLSADAVYMSWILLQTRSRTSALVLIVFCMLAFLSLKRRITVKWCNTALLVPLIYLIIPMVSTSIVQMSFLGESLYNGRELLYTSYLKQQNPASLLLGDMNTFGFENFHNGYLSIAATVGIPACLCYVHFMKTCLSWNIPMSNAPKYERIAFAGFLCLIMQTSTEAAFFVGGTNYAFLMFSVYLLIAKPYKTVEQ